MIPKKATLALLLIFSLCLNFLLPGSPAAASSADAAATLPVVDDFEYASGLPMGKDTNGISIGFVTFQDNNAATSVAISLSATPPSPVPVQGLPDPNHLLKMDISDVSYAGFVHNFESADLKTWVSQDWSAYAGISFWLYGNNSGTTLFVDVLDNRNPGSTKDDAERWSIDVPDNFSGWKQIQIPFASMHRKEVGNGAPNDGFGLTEVHGWALGAVTTPAPQVYYVDQVELYGTAPVKPLTVAFSTIEYKVSEGGAATITAKLSKPSAAAVTVQYATATEIGQAVPNRNYTPTSGTLTFAPNITQQSFTVQTMDDGKYKGDLGVLLTLANPTGGAALGLPPVARLNIQDKQSYDPALLEDFETFPYLWSTVGQRAITNPEIQAGGPLALPGQGAYERVLQVSQQPATAASVFTRGYPTGQDWSSSPGLSFWYYGQNSNKDVTLKLTNNQAAVGSPATWQQVWSDEFNGKAGAAPNSKVWGQEVGDGTTNGIPGWGNSELEYYTGGTANVAMDGKGSLVITTKQVDGAGANGAPLMCYYGPCQYTSARLLTAKRFEIAYGRVEARMKVAKGSGLWPAFWMLGTNIDQVNWPQSGEIDIMENVGRNPNQVFGTLHGPGYSGGASYGGSTNLANPVGDDYHVFAVEWQPDRITWFVDGAPFFTAASGDAFLQGKEWVFNHPFYLLMNVAVGGNFGGAVGPDATFPQTTSVDFVRVYQAAPQPVTFQAGFNDNFRGWKQLSLPFSAFQNPDGAKLDLTAVTSLSFTVPGGIKNPTRLDQIRLLCPTDVTVTSTADSGAGSLRKALGSVCVDGTVRFDPALAGNTITLTSGPYVLGKNVTIDGSTAPGLTINGGHTDRVLIVNAGATATVKNLILTNGEATDLAGGVLNNGSLTLDHVVVSNSHVNTTSFDPSTDYWKGGGGIYNGGGSTLVLSNSSVIDNSTQKVDGGGLYAFPGSTITITNSTISGNTAGNTGGAFRNLGSATITNSTISGNKALAWHGGAIFFTDGSLSLSYTTVVNNIAPDWGSSAIFIGSYSAAVPTFTIDNSFIAGNHWYACEHWTAGKVNVVSGGHNLVQDASCNSGSPDSTDIIVKTDSFGPLADNGGPTFTHALLPGSPAIDAASPSACPAADQRGISRPQGPRCDIGAFELVP